MVEAAEIGHAVGQRALPRVAKRRVAEIMGERHRLGEVFVERQRPRQRPRDLPDLDGVGQPRAKMIAVERNEHLRLMGEAAKGGRVQNPVAVALKLAARARRRLLDEPPARARRVAGVRRQRRADSQGKLPSLKDHQGAAYDKRNLTRAAKPRDIFARSAGKGQDT